MSNKVSIMQEMFKKRGQMNWFLQ